MVKIGVLALQGAVQEHIKMLESNAGVEAIPVKKTTELHEVDGLVLPGGESTTMRRLIDKYHFMEPLREFAFTGNKPVFGTCAGLILMAKDIVGNKQAHLELMNMQVERNAFGRQRESFETKLSIKDVAPDVHAVFIRAPLITKVGEEVEVLAKHRDEIVAARQGNFLACSFHPELTEDARIHQYFVEMVQTSKQAFATLS